MRYPCFALAILGAVSAFAADSSPVGINLAENTDYTPMFFFSDAMKSARGWASPDKRYEAGGVKLDADGWPLEDAAIVINASVPDLAGNYAITFSGSAKVTAPDGGLVENLEYDAAKGTGSATLVVPEGQKILTLAFLETDGGVRDVRVVRDMPAAGPFTKAFVESLAPFKILRFMDWMFTNGSKQEKWSNRSRPERAVWTRPSGVPIEVCVDLCNRVGADAWFCIPHLADEGYIREFARLVKAQLDPSRKVYIEYSNELWNFQFPQSNYFKAAATAAYDEKVKSGQAEESRRNLDLYPMIWDLQSARAANALKVFRDEFGDDSRLVPVMGSQAANSYIAKSYLKSGVLDGIAKALAIAPYFGHSAGSAANADNTLAGGLDGLFSTLGDEVAAANRKWIESNAAVAAEHGLRLVAYENGQHLVPASGDKERDARLNELFISANRDPRMGELYLKAAANWKEAGGAENVYFNHASTYGRPGYWGLVENMGQTSTPKLDAVKAIGEGKTSD